MIMHVFGNLAADQDVISILRAVYRCFHEYPEDDLDVRQQDIGGFYNYAQHERVLLAVQFPVHRYAEMQSMSLVQSVQVHTHKLERTLRIFRGRWRARSSQYRSLTLQDVLTVVRFCFNLVSVELVFRPFGRCKESQWAVNGLQRCVRWWLCFGSMSSVRILPQPLPLLFTRRYVDNRVHVYLSSMRDLQEFRFYVHPGFFSRPIVLEEVEMDEV